MTRSSSARIAYYITPHGYGHAIRSLEVIRRMLELAPRLEVILVTDLPTFLVEQNVGRLLPMRRRRLDIGMIQQDSIRFDLRATLGALRDLLGRRGELVSEETDFLRSQRIQLVVADIPALAFHAASRLGIPSIGLGNFTWDWIYEPYAASDPAWQPVIQWLREGYGRCDLFLQLPMHGDCSACPRVRDVPLVTRPIRRQRFEIRNVLGCSAHQQAYLIAFSDLDLSPEALERIQSIEDVLFFYKHPLRYRLTNGRSLDPFDLPYAEVVAAMDGVVTKPGYGIVADCLAGGTPMIYSDRGAFVEYDVLVEAIQHHLASCHLPSRDLYAGTWENALRRLSTLSRRVPDIGVDGSDVCARSILERLPTA